MKTPRKLFGGLGNQMFQMAYIFSQMKKGKIPDIYVQDFSLFKQYEKEIQEWYGNDIGYLPFVAIHIRRGDYVDNPFYVDLTQTDYYRKAMSMFPHDNFVVFCADRQEGSNDSADMEWCKEYFKGDNVQFFQGENEIEDFNMFASAKANIIANSSFSAWAAYVNPNPAKKVIAPKEWFADGKERIILPDYFLRI